MSDVYKPFTYLEAYYHKSIPEQNSFLFIIVPKHNSVCLLSVLGSVLLACYYIDWVLHILLRSHNMISDIKCVKKSDKNTNGNRNPQGLWALPLQIDLAWVWKYFSISHQFSNLNLLLGLWKLASVDTKIGVWSLMMKENYKH